MIHNPLIAEVQQDEVAGLRELAKRQQRRIEQLEKLRGYAEHRYGCPRLRYLSFPGPCTCGLQEILDELDGTR